MPFVGSNNAISTLLGALGIADTTFSAQAGDGALFPVTSAEDNFPIHLFDSANNRELVLCTTRSVDQMTVIRAQEGTTAQAWPAGTTFFGGHMSAVVFANMTQLDRVQSWTRAQNFPMTTLADVEPILWDLDKNQKAQVVITANRSITISNKRSGGAYELHVIQDATGGRLITNLAAIANWGDDGVPILSTAGTKRDILSFTVDAALQAYAGAQLGF